jgi:hypothetical protein
MNFTNEINGTAGAALRFKASRRRCRCWRNIAGARLLAHLNGGCQRIDHKQFIQIFGLQ